MRNEYNIMVGKPEEKTPLGRTRCRWKNNMIMDLRKIGWKVVDCMHLHDERDNVLVGKPEGKTPLGRTRCRWEDNIRTDLRKIG
jgi:hypothetical protein